MYGRSGTNKVFKGVKTSLGVKAAGGSIEVFQNPFSQSELQPIIPDGKAVTSVGQRLQNVSQITAGGTGVGALMCILYPGLGGGAVWYNTDGTGTLPGYTPAVTTSCQTYTQHGAWQAPASTADVGGSGVPVASMSQNAAAGTINTWRLVSQGLRLSLVNNSDQNDGWWEAIRVSPSLDPTVYCFTSSSAPTTTADWQSTGATQFTPLKAVICPNINQLNNTYAGNWVDNSTYVTGKVRDIHKNVFQLHPNNTDHDFRQLKPTFNFLTGNVYVDNQAATSGTNPGFNGGLTTLYSGYNIVQEGANTSDIVTGNIDFSYDFVLIRIHGRVGATANGPTRILSHLISNQECTYSEGTLLERFQRLPPVNKSAMNAASAALHRSVNPVNHNRVRRRTAKRTYTKKRRTVRRAYKPKRRTRRRMYM